jgi:flavorubredoxin
MKNYTVAELCQRDIEVLPFELTMTDIGRLAIELIDTTTSIITTPTVSFDPHPQVSYAVNLANILKPKLKYAAIVGLYDWRTKVVEQIAIMILNLKIEVLGAVLSKGLPQEHTFAELDTLVGLIQ